MGCNTSKESSVPTNEAEGKGNQDGSGDVTNDKSDAKTNEGNRTEKEPEDKDTKLSSAKTITLRSNGAATSVGDSEPDEQSKEYNSEKPKDPTSKVEEGEEEAATKIQAAFRGHQTRKSMKQPASKMAEKEPEPTREELEAEFRLDDAELCHAATKIQASFRGHMTRKQIDKKDEKDGKEGTSGGEEWDIDLTDPELNKAAVKIQASFRGHMNRKEGDDEK